MKIKEINRTANVAWSPQEHHPIYLAAGTAAQQLDATFSTAAALEIYHVDLASKDKSMPVAGSMPCEHRFNKLLWGSSGIAAGDHTSGLIIGGTDNGDVCVFDAAMILDNTPEFGLIAQLDDHSGPVTALDINHHQSNLLASGASDSEIFIWDLNNTESPLTPGAKTTPPDQVSCLAWNKQVQHILASSSQTGRVVVWDLRKSEPIIKVGDQSAMFNYKSMAWHPDVATQMLIGNEDDRYPCIQMWDLRFATSPMKILEGHSRGVLSLAWCQADSDLVMSCGKDNRILCWNPNGQGAAEIVYELFTTSQWTSDVKWCPRNPGLISTTSFDGHVTVSSLMGGTQVIEQTAKRNNSISDAFGLPSSNDAFAASSPPSDGPTTQYIEPLKKPPKWMRPPCGAKFSFGGKLVSFGNSADPAQRNQVHISQVVTETEFLSRSHELENCLLTGQLVEYCDLKIQACTDEKEMKLWLFLKSNFDNEPRMQFLNLLGYNPQQLAEKISNILNADAEVETEPAGVEPTVAATPTVGVDAQELAAKMQMLKTEGISSESPLLTFSGVATPEVLPTDSPAAIPSTSYEYINTDQTSLEPQPVDANSVEPFAYEQETVLAQYSAETPDAHDGWGHEALEENANETEEAAQSVLDQLTADITAVESTTGALPDYPKANSIFQTATEGDLLGHISGSGTPAQGQMTPGTDIDAVSAFDAIAAGNTEPSPFDTIAPNVVGVPSPFDGIGSEGASPFDAIAQQAPLEPSPFDNLAAPETLDTAALATGAPDLLSESPAVVPDPSPAPPVQAVVEPLVISTADDTDGLICQALLTGNFEAAVDVCFKDGRSSEGLLLAIAGGPDLFARTQKRYLDQTATTVARVISVVVNRDWRNIVGNCAIENWKEGLATLVTYGKAEEFPELCCMLGERLENEAQDYNAALVCYICAGDIEKLVACWVKSLPSEASPGELQNLIEKVMVLKKSIELERRQEVVASGDKFADQLCKYAGILASQGNLQTALIYLSTVSDQAVVVLKDRIFQAAGNAPGAGVEIPFQRVDIQPQQYIAAATPVQQPVAQPAGYFGQTTPTTPKRSQPEPVQQPYNPQPVASMGYYNPAASQYQEPAQTSMYQPQTYSQAPPQPTSMYQPPQPAQSAPPQPASMYQPTMYQPPPAQPTPPAATPPAPVSMFNPAAMPPPSQYVAPTPPPAMFSPAAPPPQPLMAPPPTSFSSPMSMKSMKQESPQTPAPEAPMSFYNPAAVQQTQQEQMNVPPRGLPPSGVLPGQTVLPAQPVQKEPEAPAPVQKGPIPSEDMVLQETFNGIVAKCRSGVNNPQTKRKLKDVDAKLEILYDKLRDKRISPNVLGGLHQMAQSCQSRDYQTGIQIHTHMISTSSFSEISSFMPGLKTLMQIANQLRV